MDNLNFGIAFGGFYESLHSGNVDSMIDNYFDEENYYSDDINYSLIYKEYSKCYVDFLNEYLKDDFDLDIKMVFTGLDSPKEYNFRTDEIIVSIAADNASAIIDLFSKDNECISFIDKASSSCSGFVSFYNGYDEVKKDSEIHLQYIFKYINSINEDDFFQYYDVNCIYELLYGIDFISKSA